MNIIAKTTKKLRGTATPPPSKSHTIRALVVALFARGSSRIANHLESDDTQDAIRSLRALGAKVSLGARAIRVKSEGIPLVGVQKSISTGNSGVTTRFLLPVLGFRKDAERAIRFNCGSQMRRRPVKSLVTALNTLGMNITPRSGAYPLSVSGALRGGEASVEGLTSQFLSALLISLPLAPKNSVITVKNLHERPYAAMTERMLRRAGIRFSHSRRGKTDTYRIPGRQRYEPFTMTIPADFSSASYVIAAAALIPGKVIIKGLDMSDAQGDKALVPILKSMGASITQKKDTLVVTGGRPLRGKRIDANAIPDLVPTLAVIATQAAGKTDIVNVAQARIKETDRLHSMTEGLSRMGARLVEHRDGLTVYRSDLRGAKVNGFDDHRTVMALSVAGMLAEGTTIVRGAEAIHKTFPGFVSLMRGIGARLTTSP